jgi:hypothetical protein
MKELERVIGLSGTLKVVVPLPAPNCTPIATNKLLYVALLCAEPSHLRKPEGTVEPVGYKSIVPMGKVVPPAPPAPACTSKVQDVKLSSGARPDNC